MKETDNGIEYSSDLISPGRTRFTLYAILNTHTEEVDVKKAIAWLYYKYKKEVHSIQVRWRRAEDGAGDLLKLPDSVIISELKVEIGKLKSEIDELRDEKGQWKHKYDIERQRNNRDETLKKKNKDLQATERKLRQEISRLVTENLRLKGKI